MKVKTVTVKNVFELGAVELGGNETMRLNLVTMGWYLWVWWQCDGVVELGDSVMESLNLVTMGRSRWTWRCDGVIEPGDDEMMLLNFMMDSVVELGDDGMKSLILVWWGGVIELGVMERYPWTWSMRWCRWSWP
jgi:hypothetical protein